MRCANGSILLSFLWIYFPFTRSRKKIAHAHPSQSQQELSESNDQLTAGMWEAFEMVVASLMQCVYDSLDLPDTSTSSSFWQSFAAAMMSLPSYHRPWTCLVCCNNWQFPKPPTPNLSVSLVENLMRMQLILRTDDGWPITLISTGTGEVTVSPRCTRTLSTHLIHAWSLIWPSLGHSDHESVAHPLVCL